MGHRELRPPATEPVSLADGGGHNEGPSETQSLRRDVRTSITGMRSGDMSAEYLPTLQPPTGAPPQHGVSALSSHASSSRSPTRPPEGVPAGREDQSLGEVTSSLLPRRRRGHECHRHVPRVPPPSASPWPLPPPGGRERGSICVYEVCVWRLSLPVQETQVFRIANALILAGHL